MPLTRSFKSTIKARAARDPSFRAALLSEGMQAMLQGDLATGKSVIRDCINATIGFDGLAAETGTPAKSLMRMFSASGNPRAANLMAVVGALQRCAGFELEIKYSA
jgi:DNA-binding phage protein